MPPARRPGRPAPRALPPKKKGSPLVLWGGIGGGVLLLVIIVILAVPSGGSPAAPPMAPPRPKATAAPKPAAPKAPATTVHFHQTDTGTHRVITVLVGGTGSKNAANLRVVDGKGKKYDASSADAKEHFTPELAKDSGARALRFTLPADTSSADLLLPEGAPKAVYRAPRPADRVALPGTADSNGTKIKASGSMKDGAFELEIETVSAGPRPLRPETLTALADGGLVFKPNVASRSPLRLRYDVPESTREIRIQIEHRTPKPRYLVFKTATAPKPVAAKPAAPAPEKPDVKKLFEARRSDLVGALKFLATQPVDQARPIAREAVATAIGEDLAAGMKAFLAGDAATAEKYLARAALLGAPYQPEFSRQLMRMIFLSGKPRRTLTGCTVCSGAGAHACKDCTQGRKEGDCPRCETQGKVDCLLCTGSGQLDHFGYRGKIELKIPRSFRIRVNVGGKTRTGTMHAQTITYTMNPCSGSGSFHLAYESVNAKSGQRTPGSTQQTCDKFWEEMKRNVFNGKARIRIPDRSGAMTPFSTLSARRFFGDFEKCASGHVTCDRCDGKKRNTCIVCTGKGKADVQCGTCEGTTLRPCGTCHGYGESAWLKKLMPSAPALAQALTDQAGAIRAWLDARARIAVNKERIAVQLTEAKKGLDTTAKLSPDLVDVKCGRCKGRGGNCSDCWATGRREFHAGTSTYAQYSLAGMLERRLKATETASADTPLLAMLPKAESATAIARPAPPAPPKLVFREVAVPSTIEEMIRKADELFKKGTGHLQNSKGSKDNATWINEGHLALEALRNAQTLYATAQETLDAKGLNVPKALIKKFRTNMQALVMARKQLP